MMLANRSAVVQSINQVLGRRHIRATQFVAAIVLLAIGAVALPANAQMIIYVNSAAAAGGNGESWGTAHNATARRIALNHAARK
jgi:hypothetical protein